MNDKISGQMLKGDKIFGEPQIISSKTVINYYRGVNIQLSTGKHQKK